MGEAGNTNTGLGGGGGAVEGGNANAGLGGGASGGAPAAGASGSAGSSSSGLSGQPTGMSRGCGAALPSNVATGVWVDMADELTNSPPAVQVPGANPGDPPIPRGYWIYVPNGYDPNVPHRVIYVGTGWDDTSPGHGGSSGYAFQMVDGTDPVPTIQVGLEYSDHDPGTTDANSNGYDEWVKSSDFRFFPLLHHLIEDQLCVDLHRQFIAGFETGGFLANQFACAFPDVLRGVVEASGIAPREQPPCVSGHPTAGLFVHDVLNMYEPYDTILPACTHLLGQNGCTVTTCNPSDPATTTPYAPGRLYPYGPSTTLHCVSFLGCPPDSPVVFCTTEQKWRHAGRVYR